MSLQNGSDAVKIAARWYAKRGLCIYPADGKHPLIRGWNDGAATSDPERAAAYFTEFPDAALGIACGPSGIVVIDVDPRNGGDKSWLALCGDLGLETFDHAPVALTPSGGQHVYFKAPTGTTLRSGAHMLGPGIDVIGAKGGVIAPPSVRAGAPYRWHAPTEFIDQFCPPEMPTQLVDRIRSRQVNRAAKALADRLPTTIEAGARNDTLMRVATKLRWRFALSESELIAALLATNAQRCKPPLSEKEVAMIASSMSTLGASTIDPVMWLDGWLHERLSESELRIVTAYATLADCILGPLTPAAAAIEQRTGISSENYYRIRKRIQDRGAIRVINQGRNRAPVIELLMRTPA
jgi:hypothetical protein